MPLKATDYFIVLIGPSKHGKTTWANLLGDGYFLDTENGLRLQKESCGKEIPEDRQCRVKNWAGYLTALKSLEIGSSKNALPFDYIVLDTVSILYDMCLDHVCKANNVSAPGDAPHGIVWSKLGIEWKRGIQRLNSLDKGLVFVAHSKQKETQIIERGIQKTVPMLGMDVATSAANVVSAAADYIFHVIEDRTDPKNPKLVLQTKPMNGIEAGDRSGKLPDTIPFDAKWFSDYCEKTGD